MTLQNIHRPCKAKPFPAGIRQRTHFLLQLRHLNLSGCGNISDNGLAHVMSVACVGLEDSAAASHLRLAGNNGINCVASACHQLLSLDLHDCYDVTDSGLSCIALLPQLRILNLSSCQNISDEGVVHLAPLQRNLRELNLNKCWRITDIGLASVGVLDQLQHLLLSRCSITDAGIGCLMHLKHLAKLFLCGCDQITGSGFADLAAPSPIIEVDVSFCGITDAGSLASRHYQRLRC